VKDFGATGDGETDDTEAFEKAIAVSDKIFIPRGQFKLSGTLALREKTRMFGISKMFCSIGTARGDASRPIENSAVTDEDFRLKTPNDADCAPGLYFLSVGGSVDWQSGKGTWYMSNGRPVFSGNGGGKFYGFGAMRIPYVLESIRQPTDFYALNVERVRDDPQFEIRNCSNIRLFYFKVEAGSSQSSNMEDLSDANTPCIITASSNISVYCMTGVVIKLREDQQMLGVVDSNAMKLVHIKSFAPGVFPQVREKYEGQEVIIPSDRIASLYVRN
jgi:hypothetical protein